MKRIRGLDRPTPGLRRFHADPDTVKTWDALGAFEAGAARRELTGALVAAQHRLCAYCEINIVEHDRRVEHFVPQSDPRDGAAMACDHRNLLAVCMGGSASVFAPGTRLADPRRFLPPARQNLSCDAAKGDKPASGFVDPRDAPSSPSVFVVTPDGRIASDPEACEQTGVSTGRVDTHIEHLGLNVPRLRLQREAVWAALTAAYSEAIGSPTDLPALLHGLAEQRLLPDPGGSLARFFTTSRSFFGPVADDILARAPQDWV